MDSQLRSMSRDRQQLSSNRNSKNGRSLSRGRNSFDLKKMIGPLTKRFGSRERQREISQQNKEMCKKLVKIKMGNNNFSKLMNFLESQRSN